MCVEHVKFSDAFRETMHRFRLKGVDIADKAGLAPVRISEFRQGANLHIKNLEHILNALPQEAREYMLGLVARPDEERPPGSA